MELFNVENAWKLFKEIPPTSDGEDLNELIFKHLMKAKHTNDDIYIFGDAYPYKAKSDDSRDKKLQLMKRYGLKGIHNVHMNQRKIEREHELKENGMYQDGGIFIYDADANQWTAILIKFQSHI